MLTDHCPSVGNFPQSAEFSFRQQLKTVPSLYKAEVEPIFMLKIIAVEALEFHEA